jgi:hypothetical protein
MQPLAIQFVLPITIYIIFSLLDSSHTLALLRKPGIDTSVDLPIDELVNKDENTLEFLKNKKQLGKSLVRDWNFLDWFYPRSDYEVDKEFEDVFTKSKGRWYTLKFIGWLILSTCIVIKLFKRELSTTTAGTFIVTCILFVLSIGTIKLCGRTLYRFTLWILLAFNMLQDSLLKFLEKNIFDELKTNDLIDKDSISSVKRVFERFVERAKLLIDEERNKDVDIDESIINDIDPNSNSLQGLIKNVIDEFTYTSFEDVNKRVVLADVENQNFIKQAKDAIIYKFRLYHIDHLKSMIMPSSTNNHQSLAYDWNNFTVSSMCRFILLDRKGTFLAVLILIACYIVSGGYNLAYKFADADDDEIDHDDNQINKTTKLFIDLLKSNSIAFVYITLYFIGLAFLRQAMLKITSSLMMKKPTSIISFILSEMMHYSHKYMAYHSEGFKAPFKKQIVYILKAVAITIISAFLLLLAYILLTTKPKDDHDDVLKSEHYIEANKTIAICAIICIVTYTVTLV